MPHSLKRRPWSVQDLLIGRVYPEGGRGHVVVRVAEQRREGTGGGAGGPHGVALRRHDEARHLVVLHEVARQVDHLPGVGRRRGPLELEKRNGGASLEAG